MKSHVLALLASAFLLLVLGTGSAWADAVPGAVQSADQSAATGQSASATAGAEQIAPKNTAISVRIGSSGDNGAVTQSNSNGASAAAGNEAKTIQSAAQLGGGGTQFAEQAAGTLQAANAKAKAVQVDPSNEAISVRIHSEGNNGPVKQSNTNGASAEAGNAALTKQSADQAGGAGTQHADQSAGTKQDADADAHAVQKHPSNEAISVRIHSAGDDGPVNQSNVNGAEASAGNAAATSQDVEQDAATDDGKGCCGGGGTAVQAAGQSAGTGQTAKADAVALQCCAKNVAGTVRIHSPGDNGAVKQSNVNGAGSKAGNKAITLQDVAQSTSGDDRHGCSRGCACRTRCDSCTCGSCDAKRCGDDAGTAVQAAGQEASTLQSADASAVAFQAGATNVAEGVHKDSDGHSGSVHQSNVNGAEAAAGNAAWTSQAVSQALAGGAGVAVQAAGQEAQTLQSASAVAEAVQLHPLNLSAPVALGGSHGDGGWVWQRNANAAAGQAGNGARTEQGVGQVA